MIKCTSVTKKYVNIVAVNNVSLEINKNNIVGLLGPNGAGKSTLMRIMSGYLIPDEGRVYVDDLDIFEEPELVKRKIGYMPENNPLYKDIMVKDQLELAMDLYSIPSNLRKKYLDFAVEVTNIGDVYYKEISELSKGYKQRVGLAQALVCNPEILILDEPTEGLDPVQRIEIRSLIKDIAKEKTIIISTHIMQEVEAVCERIVLINKGNILFDDSIENFKLKQQNNDQIVIKLKGKDIENKFRSNTNIFIKFEIEPKNEYEVIKITANLNEEFYRNLNKFIYSNDFVVYEMYQVVQNLDEVFRSLAGETKKE